METNGQFKGVITKYVKERGFGFIACDKKSYFFHMNEVWEEQIPLLLPGANVKFALGFGQHSGNSSQEAAMGIEVMTKTPTPRATTTFAATETVCQLTGRRTSYARATVNTGSLISLSYFESAVEIYKSMKARLSKKAELQETENQLKRLLSTGLMLEIEANLKVQLEKTEGKLKQIPDFSEREQTLFRFLEEFCKAEDGEEETPEEATEGAEGEEGGGAPDE